MYQTDFDINSKNRVTGELHDLLELLSATKSKRAVVSSVRYQRHNSIIE